MDTTPPIQEKIQQQEPHDIRRQVESPPIVENPPVATEPIISTGSPIDEEKGGFPPVLRILIGLIVVGILGFIIFGVVFPLLSKQTSGKVTVTYWGLWEDPRVMQAVLSDFERQNPNITVKYSKEDPQQYSGRLLTRIANGTGPDVFRFHTSWLPMVQNVLLPLPSTVIAKNDFTQNYFPVVQADVIKQGGIYGIPLGIDDLALFTNTQLFQATGAKIPTTWNDFISVARSLTVKDETGKIKTAGAAMGTFDNITHAPDIMSLLFIQNGADVHNLSATAQNASDAINFYTSLAKDSGNVWDATLEPSLNGFIAGNVAMYFGYSYDIFTIKAANPSLQFTVSSVPHLPGKDVTIASYWVEGISNKSAHQKEAVLLMKYLAQKTTAEKFYSEAAKTRLFGEPYARSDLAATLSDNPLIFTFVTQAKNAQSSFFAGETKDIGINAQMNGYLGNAVRSVLGDTSAQTAVDTLSKGVTQVLQKYGVSQ